MPIFWESGKVEYEGLVLGERECNGYHDSYFYAIVWNAEKGAPEEVEYGATAYPGGGFAKVDASPEVRAAYEAWVAAIEAKKVRKGRVVRVLVGKLAGAVGEVFWIGSDKFRRGAKRVGLKVNGESVFCPFENVEVVPS